MFSSVNLKIPLLGVLVALFLSSIFVSTATYADVGPTTPLTIPTSKSTSWAGYGDVVNTSVVTIDGVFISFKQPKVTCDPSLTSPQEVQFLVGIDGYNVSSIFYVGTDVTCSIGSSTPVYSAVSSGSGSVSSVAIKPGDKIEANITISGGTLTYELSNSKGASGLDSGSAPDQGVNSAECVVSSIIAVTGEPLPLAKFATVKIGQDYTDISNTCFITSNGGILSPIGMPPPPDAIVIRFVMYNFALTSIRANPSSLTASLSSFKVKWVSYGP
jgi:Peptidase A4 family